MSSQSDREILPKDLKPFHYTLFIHSIDINSYTFAGNVIIDFDVKAETAIDAIHLNSKGLNVSKALVKIQQSEKTESTVDITDISYEEKADALVLKLSDPITPSASKVQVSIDFDGKIWDDMAGFYRSRYNIKGKDAVMLSTQFAAADARRAFPCVDEPNQKATFDFKIAVPENWTALSNMPVISSNPIDGDHQNSVSTDIGSPALKIVTFETTPIMSTYLLAWAVGEFDYIEDFTERTYGGEKLPVRVYTTRGLVQQGQLALRTAIKIIDLYSKLFDIEFMLPKCDLLAVHEFSYGAMENWGLITFKTTGLLYDEETSDSSYKQRVVYIVAHELAHQWFGNLVTMDWWNELWLNEGFATWVGWFAVDYLYPEWDVFTKFVTDVVQGALGADSVRNSHPIEVPVRSVLQINQVFDNISYLKGASSIRMLSSQLTENIFLKGVSNYLKAHSYANARTGDLWASLSEVSGVDVQTAMQNWITKIGYPLLKVEEDPESGNVTIRQDRFLSTGDVSLNENDTEWWIPLVIDAESSSEAVASFKILNGREIVIPGLAKGYFLLNKDQTGVYRVSYSEERLAKLSKTPDKLSPKDKVGLIADAASTAAAGIASITGVLTLVNGLGNETHNSVWYEILERLATMRSIWSLHSKEVSDGLNKLTGTLVSPTLERLGWEFPEQEDFLTSQLRSKIIEAAGAVGVKSVVEEARHRFNKYKAGDRSAIHPSIKRCLFSTVLQYTTGKDLQEAYEVVRKELANPTSVDGRDLAACALGNVKDESLIKISLGMILSGEVPAQDVHTISKHLAANPYSRKQTWEYVKSNWEAIYEAFSSNTVVLSRLISSILFNYASEENYHDISAFFKDKDNDGYDRALSQALDVIRVRYQYANRDTISILKWLKDNNY